VCRENRLHTTTQGPFRHDPRLDTVDVGEVGIKIRRRGYLSGVLDLLPSRIHVVHKRVGLLGISAGAVGGDQGFNARSHALHS
jgi:hypothetical protein